MADEMPCEQCRQRASTAAAATTTAAAAAAATDCIKLAVYPCGRDGHFELTVSRTTTVDNLKRAIAKKLNVAKERLCLLHKEKQLQDGTLPDNNIHDGNKILLLPMVETGLLAQRPEQCVLQALERLNDSEVNDFLSGRAPLNLTMRLGDHMMFIQLQLSTASTSQTSASTSTPRLASSTGHQQSKTATAAAVAAATTTTATAAAANQCPSTTNDTAKSAADPTSHRMNRLLDAKTLASASRSLSHTLRRLSTHVADTDPTAASTSTSTSTSMNGDQVTAPSLVAPPAWDCGGHHEDVRSQDGRTGGRAGAIIESMHHHGKGVYSGTFSGTLNPALQDRNGLPKRDISTIVHILNDLLGASPQYRRYHRTHHHNQSSSTSSSSSSSSLSSSSSGDALATTLAASSGGVRRRSDRSASGKSAEEFSRLSQENMATRGKMEQLRAMLEERRVRRRTRRESPRWSPYGTPTSWTTPPSTATTSVPLAPPPPPSTTMSRDESPKSPLCSNGGNGTGNSNSSGPAASDTSSDNSMDCTGASAAGTGTGGGDEYLTANPVVA